MDYSVHFFVNGEELFQVFDAPIPRVGDHVSRTIDATDSTFVVSSVQHNWILGRAGRPSLYVTVALGEADWAQMPNWRTDV